MPLCSERWAMRGFLMKGGCTSSNSSILNKTHKKVKEMGQKLKGVLHHPHVGLETEWWHYSWSDCFPPRYCLVLEEKPRKLLSEAVKDRAEDFQQNAWILLCFKEKSRILLLVMESLQAKKNKLNFKSLFTSSWIDWKSADERQREKLICYPP